MVLFGVIEQGCSRDWCGEEWPCGSGQRCLWCGGQAFKRMVVHKSGPVVQVISLTPEEIKRCVLQCVACGEGKAVILYALLWHAKHISFSQVA